MNYIHYEGVIKIRFCAQTFSANHLKRNCLGSLCFSKWNQNHFAYISMSQFVYFLLSFCKQLRYRIIKKIICVQFCCFYRCVKYSYNFVCIPWRRFSINFVGQSVWIYIYIYIQMQALVYYLVHVCNFLCGFYKNISMHLPKSQSFHKHYESILLSVVQSLNF